MNKKILIGLIILGVFFVGSATYALFNENLLLNDVTSDIQTNDTSRSNQLNIQNNLANTQNNPLSNIISGGNSNFVLNTMANVVLNDIGENDNDGQKIVNEVYRFTSNNKTLVEFDDSSFLFTVDNQTFDGKFGLTKIYDVDGVSGGYIECSDCGKFVPVGDVSGLVSEDYLCDCGAYIMSIKDVPFVFSEESVLQNIKYAEYYKDTFGIEASNPFDVPSKNTDTIDNISVSDEVPQENVENTYSDYSAGSDKIIVPPFEYELMDWSDINPWPVADLVLD